MGWELGGVGSIVAKYYTFAMSKQIYPPFVCTVDCCDIGNEVRSFIPKCETKGKLVFFQYFSNCQFRFYKDYD